MILTIAGREWRGLFYSPLAWTLLAVLQALLAWVFLSLLQEFLALQGRLAGLEAAPGVTDLVATPLLKVAGWLLLILTPLLTMQAIGGEHRRHTLDLLLAAPVTSYEIVLGKFLGLFGFLLIAIGLCSLMPLALLAGTSLDLGKLAAGLLGLMLLAGSYLAAGLYLSAALSQPAAAGVATFGLLLLLWIVDAAAGPATATVALFAWLSLARHFETLLQGLVSSADVVYYLLFIGCFLALTVRRLENRRLVP